MKLRWQVYTTVSSCTLTQRGGLGWFVIVEHFGGYYSLYANLDEIIVNKDQKSPHRRDFRHNRY